jgi:hypothetical protein
MRRLVRLAERQGWTVTMTHRNHLKFRSPGGELVHTGMTPSDHGAILNTAAELRHAGLDTKDRNR